MFTSLDYLVLVFISFAAITMISLCLMFLIRNRITQKVFFYITLALGIIVANFGFMMSSGLFPMQTIVAIIAALACIAALVLSIVGKGNKKILLVARVIAAVALVAGFLNAFII